MSDYTPEDIVKYSTSKDGARVKEAIQSVLADKVVRGLEAKKAEVAQAMFNSAVKPESSETVEPSAEASEVDAEEA